MKLWGLEKLSEKKRLHAAEKAEPNPTSSSRMTMLEYEIKYRSDV